MNVWYPSVDDIADINITALDIGRDKHPHRLLYPRSGVQAVIDRVRASEDRGLNYQAALMIKELARSHLFAGGNHRTAYLVAKCFLRRNGKRFKVARLDDAYTLISRLETKTLEQTQEWIEHGESEGA